MTQRNLRPTKSRRPKCPSGIVPRWRAKLGWGFRAKRMIEGKTHWGEIRNSKDEARRDWIDLGDRAAAVESVEEILTFEAAIELMLAETKSVQRSPATLRQYKERLAHVWRHFHNIPLHEITRQRVEHYRDTRLKTPTHVKSCACKRRRQICEHKGRIAYASASTVNKELQALNRVFQVAIDKDRLPGQNPMLKVTRLKTKRKEAHHYPASEVVEILAVIRDCSERCRSAAQFHDEVAVLFTSGMRVGELGHLRVKNVDLRRGVLNVPEEGKTGWRAIPMPDGGPLLAVLSRMVEGLSPDDYVLGKPPELSVPDLKRNRFTRWSERLPKHLRRGFHAHTFRHSFVSQLGATEIPEHRMRKLAGHEPKSVSQGYMHATELQLRRDMARAFDHLTKDLLGGWGPNAIAEAT